MEELRKREGFLCDMDGVIYHGNKLLPGVKEFVNWLQDNDKKFLFLTNSSRSTPVELANKLARMGLDVDPSHFYTSALATARFLASQMPNCTAYVLGEHGLQNALYEYGIPFNDIDPDYVVFGEPYSYNYDQIARAIQMVAAGARLIGTNSDLTSPSDHGVVPSCRALIAPIELATGKQAYFVGKPNPLMMRTGLHLLGAHSENSVMIGDRMDTDMIAGIETGLDTALVLSGVTEMKDLKQYPYRPRLILNGVCDIPD